jgi:hypothetical protein
MTTRTFVDALLRGTAPSSFVASSCAPYGFAEEQTHVGTLGNLDQIQKPAGFRW